MLHSGWLPAKLEVCLRASYSHTSNASVSQCTCSVSHDPPLYQSPPPLLTYLAVSYSSATFVWIMLLSSPPVVPAPIPPSIDRGTINSHGRFAHLETMCSKSYDKSINV